MELDALRPNGGFAAQALQAAERARARLLLEQLNEGGAAIYQGADRELLKRRDALDRTVIGQANAEAALLARSHTAAQAEEAARKVRMALEDLRNAETELRRSSPRYTALTQPNPLSAREIQTRVLDADTVLLEYWLGAGRSWVWAVSARDLRVYELPSRDILAAQARDYHAALSGRGPKAGEQPAQRRRRLAETDRKIQDRGATLSRVLLAPVAGAIRGKRLALVRGDALELVPFAALPDPGDTSRPLVEGHEIVALPSASALASLRSATEGRRTAGKLLAVFADPVFDASDPRVQGGAVARPEAGTGGSRAERAWSESGPLRRLPSSSTRPSDGR